MSLQSIIPLIASGVALAFTVYLILHILRQDEGDEGMVEIARAIRLGASVFLRRELTALSLFSGSMAVILALFIHPEVALAFVVGTAASFGAGYIGMWVATRANVRTANIVRSSFTRGMKTAFFGGSVMGAVSVSLGLLGLAGLFLFFQTAGDVEVWLGYAFGASSVALFLRVGGGIFTKSADVGADLVGKVEAGIPEDDPRNPAVIADNVGDNVGDVAGMGSDLYESYVSALAAAMVLGIVNIGIEGALIPLLLGAAGLLASLVGIAAVRPKEVPESYEEEAREARSALNRGVYVSTGLMVILGYFTFQWVMGPEGLGPFAAMIAGLMGGAVIGLSTQYFTSEYGPVRGIAAASNSGAAINIIEGLAMGMLSTVIPVLVVVVATLVAFYSAGFFGIAIAAVGMLVTLAMLLSTDAYGPIADNAAGIAEMSGLGKEARERAEALDAVGNTTAAVGKGFAIASAALASLAWIVTFLKVAEVEEFMADRVEVVAGLLIGAMLSFLFSALTLKAVSAGAFEVVGEVRRQFDEIPGLREGTAKPDYEACISLVTKRAIKAMFLPSIIVILAPLAVGFILGREALAGLLLGALFSGFLLAVAMANAGGAWDNAKKLIESGLYGGKGGDAHKAAVIGDTVGDPFKDTSGPALNILIKLVGKVAVIFAPLFLLFV
ncbi:MAG: sodium-translocating pyrophosphatase [Thermoplasmata archaeon]